MVASILEPADLDKDQARAIAALSEKLHLPAQQVRQVYLEEFGRLGSQARVRSFLSVLALSRARAVLRSGGRFVSRN